MDVLPFVSFFKMSRQFLTEFVVFGENELCKYIAWKNI
jgi:hypothetical protein